MSSDPTLTIVPRLGEEVIIEVVRKFYEQVPADPVLGPMYPPEDLKGAEIRLHEFLIFRFGGDDRYLRHRGHPALRMRHVPFAVTQKASEHWIRMMGTALDQTEMPDDAREVMRTFLSSTANFLINRREG